MSLCRVGTTLRLSRLMAAEPQLAERHGSNRLRRRSSWSPTQPQFVTPGFGLPTGAPLQGLQAGTTTSGLWTTRDGASTATSPTSRPSAGDANDATESTPARDAADAAMMPVMGQGPQAFPMMPAAQQMMMPTQVPNLLPMISPDDAGIYDIQPRMVECAGYDGVCSLNWLMDIASC